MASDSPAATSISTPSRIVSGWPPLLTCLLTPAARTALLEIMFKRFLICGLLLCFASLVQAASAAPASAKAPVWLVLGDSLSAAYGIPQSAGWVALLQQRHSAIGGVGGIAATTADRSRLSRAGRQRQRQRRNHRRRSGTIAERKSTRLNSSH